MFPTPYRKNPTYDGLARKWEIVYSHEIWLTTSLWLGICEQQVQSAENPLLYERLHCLFSMFWQKAIQTCQASKVQEDLKTLFQNQILTSAFCRFTTAVFYTGLCTPCPYSISDFFSLASFMSKTMNRDKVNAWRDKYLRFFGPLVVIFIFRVVVLFLLLFFSQVWLTCVRLFYILIQHKVILGADGVG